MSIIWQDESSYSRNDKERIPNVWVARIGLLKILIIYNHIQYSGQWVFSCEPFYRHKEMGNVSTIEAQVTAIKLVKQVLEGIITLINKLEE